MHAKCKNMIKKGKVRVLGVRRKTELCVHISQVRGRGLGFLRSKNYKFGQILIKLQIQVVFVCL